MNAREDCLKFARFNGLQVKGDRHGIVTAFHPKTEWVDCFEGWVETQAFFKAAIDTHYANGTQYPWERARKARLEAVRKIIGAAEEGTAYALRGKLA